MLIINERKNLGFLAENIAARYLQEKGYEIVERNYLKPWGEVDIIAAKAGVVSFVEVKANRQEFPGDFNPELRVDRDKIARITKTAFLYLEHELSNAEAEWQVDIISVTFDQLNKKAKIKHFKNIASDIF